MDQRRLVRGYRRVKEHQRGKGVDMCECKVSTYGDCVEWMNRQRTLEIGTVSRSLERGSDPLVVPWPISSLCKTVTLQSSMDRCSP